MTSTPSGTPSNTKPLFKRAGFILPFLALSMGFTGLMLDKLEGSDFTFIAIAVVGGVQAVNYRERSMTLTP